MSLWSGPYTVVVLVLLVAGAAKAWDPVMTAGALRSAGLPVPSGIVRVFGAAEAVLALAALVVNRAVPAAAVAASYAVFCGFVVLVQVRHLPLASCGCFGRADTPPTALHIILDGAAALVAAGAAVAGSGGGRIAAMVAAAHQPWAGVPFYVSAVVGAAAMLLCFVWLPRFEAGRRAPARVERV